jgi:hypothetical protein
MKHTLFLILIFIGFGAFSQNYKGVVEGDTTYYLSKIPSSNSYIYADSNNLRVIYTDSVQVIGSDKHNYFYRTIRPQYPNTNFYCFDTVGASWMGKYSITKSNGDELYFNFKGDTILIRTQATLNDTWRITTDTNGVEIWGTFTQVYYSTIDYQIDTIKVITLQAYANGIPIVHPHNNQELKLSKNHGFLTAFEWNYFPYTQVPINYSFFVIDTELHTRLDKHYVDMDLNYINFQTMFNPGTYWQLRDSGYTFTGYPDPPVNLAPHGIGYLDVYIQDSVLNKTILNADTMVVELQRILKYYHSVLAAPIPPNQNPGFQDTNLTAIFNYTDTIVKKPKFTIRNNIFPESKLSFDYATVLAPSIASIPTYSVIQYSDSMFFLRGNSSTASTYMYNSQLNCISMYSGVSGKYAFNSGFIRQINYRPTYLYIWSGSIVERDVNSFMYFYHDSSVTIGTPLNLKTLSVDDISKSENPIYIYPNPSLSGIFNINAKNSFEWEVFDLRGLKLFSGNSTQINLETYPSGMYILKVDINGKMYYSKLIR